VFFLLAAGGAAFVQAIVCFSKAFWIGPQENEVESISMSKLQVGL
jgi:hypothetical protein